MRLLVAIVPPTEVLAELDGIIGAVSPASATRSDDGRTPSSSGTGQHAAPRRRLFAGGRGQAQPDPEPQAPAPHNELARTSVAGMHIPIATIGHLTQGDSLQLRTALRTSAATWPRPALRFAGGTALEWPGDRSVWAKIDGDLDRLHAVGKGVPEVVKRLALFVDRRAFHPWLSVGTITEETTAPYLEDLVSALDRFEGSTWTQESFSLLKATMDNGSGAEFETVEEMQLADG